MQPRRFSLTGLDPVRKFRVVIAFDNSATSSSSALRTCDYVISQLGGDVPVRRRVFDLENMNNPRTRAAAAKVAAGADMVIVSTKESAQLPERMKEWLDEWSGQRSAQEGAFVAIINRANEQRHRASTAVKDQLALLAQQMHMDFFSSEVSV